MRPTFSPTGSVGSVFRYWSTSAAGRLVPVSGVLYRPAWHPPGPPPVIAWGHGTYGLGEHCTNEVYFADPACTGVITLAVSRGAVLVATDYQGLGTPGPHPYLAGRVAGANVLDSVAAAVEAGATGRPARVLLFGWSQGGNAVLHAAEARSGHAPWMRVVGVIATAPAAELDSLIGWLDGTPQFGYILMAAYGFRAAYPELAGEASGDLDASVLDGIGDMCVRDILERFAGGRAADHGLSGLVTHPLFAAHLRANSPGSRPTGVPMLLEHGERDDVVPARASRTLRDRYAALGDDVTAHFYDYVGHPDIMDAAMRRIVEFTDDRLTS
jgi:predicted esterase